MHTHTKLLAGVILAAMTATAVQAEDTGDKEKCYGIAKAGKNDCASKMAGNSCASLSTKDGQGFIIVPKGTCEKISGGSTTEKK